VIASVGVVLAIALPSQPDQAHERKTAPADPGAIASHRKTAEQRIAAYNAAFPTIHFVLFEGGDGWHGEAIALATALGPDAEPIDYEHPAALRPHLMHVTLERIVHMLRSNTISATTFRLAAGNPFGRSHLCVITLNPLGVAKDEAAATHALLAVNDGAKRQIDPSRFLDPDDHLAFAIDHEAFHCLDSVLYGGVPRTTDPLRAEYNELRRESAADAFALAMHMREHGRVTSYARNITLIRGLQPFLANVTRGTYDALHEIQATDPQQLAETGTREIARLAHERATRAVGSYEEFVEYRAALYRACKAVGLHPGPDNAVADQLSRVPAKPEQIANQVDRYRYLYAQLFTASDVRLDPSSSSGPN